VKVRFECPECGVPGKIILGPSPESGAGSTAKWQCPACDHRLETDSGVTSQSLPVCAICGGRELYKKKNFPHTLGLTILTIACVVSFITYLNYEKILTWAILGGTALFDVVLFLWVGDAVVCYKCGAVHTQFTPGPEHHPFDLGISERYRQERIRREQLQSEKR